MGGTRPTRVPNVALFKRTWYQTTSARRCKRPFAPKTLSPYAEPRDSLQALAANARRQIAKNLGCSSQTVRNAIQDFNRRSLDALVADSSRPKQTHAAFGAEGSREALQELLHRSPREFGRQNTWWTLDMAAEVSFEEGMTAKRVTGQTVRATLERLGKSWQRAKGWIESPDPEYARKKGLETG